MGRKENHLNAMPQKKRLDLLREQSYLNGSFCDADAGKTIQIINPATGDQLGVVPNMGAGETTRAIEAAAGAFASWSGLLAQQRADLMMAWHGLIIKHQEEIAHILVLENGKPLKEARTEVGYCAAFVRWFAAEGRRIYGDIIPPVRPDSEIRVTKHPVGVAAAITPWNFPAAMITRKCAAALAAGCTIVMKPSELTPYTALALAALADKAGLPAGVLNIITGEPQAIGQVFTEHPFVKKISFTGSTRVGKLLMGQSAAGVKKLSLELGGNAPFLVFDDADLAQAVTEVMASKFRNSGQTCVCANRVYVQQGVYDEFVSLLKQEVVKLKVGNGMEAGVEQGPLINEEAVRKVERHVRESLAKGAQLVCGGKRHALGGTFFEPTILRDVPLDAPPTTEETFGPLLPLYRFTEEKEAVELANRSRHGLAAFFCTQNLQRAYRVSEALAAGLVGVNSGLVSSEVAPFGGIKESGFGREGSKYGIDEYLYVKYTLFNYG